MSALQRAVRAAVLASLGVLALTGLQGADAAHGAGRAGPHDNGRIAFAADTGLVLMNGNGSGQWGGKELLPGDAGPSWSPDGTLLAIATHWVDRQGIRIADPTGAHVRMLTYDGNDSDPAWSPDGRRIAFTNNGRLWIVDADGSNRRLLTSDTAYKTHPTWSPDGTRIAYAAADESTCCAIDIWVLDLASGARTRLTSDSAEDTSPVWSPDGRRIAFTSNRDNTSQVWVMDADGSNEVRLTLGWDRWPAWSPDGSTLLFVHDGDIWSIPGGGGAPQRLTTQARVWSSGPSWQPVTSLPGCSITGTEASDLLVGGDGPDTICGLGGNDTLIGLAGNDAIDGGPGNDWIAGGAEFDTLSGGTGIDRIDARDGDGDYVVAADRRSLVLTDPRGDRVAGKAVRRASYDLAAWRRTTASGSSPAGLPVVAVDGRIDDWWNSGGYPTQWIEIDLGAPTDLGRVRLVTGEQPAATPILVLGRGSLSAGTYRQLARFSGPTTDRQELVRTTKIPWKKIRWVRVLIGSSQGSLGWASMREIELYPPGH